MYQTACLFKNIVLYVVANSVPQCPLGYPIDQPAFLLPSIQYPDQQYLISPPHPVHRPSIYRRSAPIKCTKSLLQGNDLSRQIRQDALLDTLIHGLGDGCAKRIRGLDGIVGDYVDVVVQTDEIECCGEDYAGCSDARLFCWYSTVSCRFCSLCTTGRNRKCGHGGRRLTRMTVSMLCAARMFSRLLPKPA